MISPNQALKAGAYVGITEILTELNCLINSTISIAKVSRLGITDMNSEALGRAGGRGQLEKCMWH